LDKEPTDDERLLAEQWSMDHPEAVRILITKHWISMTAEGTPPVAATSQSDRALRENLEIAFDRLKKLLS